MEVKLESRNKVFMNWEDEFRKRIDDFKSNLPIKGKGLTLSIKIRVVSGCFCRDHCSPNTYQIIDTYLHMHPSDDFAFEEHESGPEILVYITLGAAGINFAASIINLITAIIKARSEGIKRGDRARSPIELIVRGFNKKGELREEKVLTFESHDVADRKLLEQALQTSANKIILSDIKKKRHSIKKKYTAKKM